MADRYNIETSSSGVAVAMLFSTYISYGLVTNSGSRLHIAAERRHSTRFPEIERLTPEHFQVVRTLFLLLLAAAIGCAESDSDAKLRSSVAKQLESVRRQTQRAGQSGFFSSPWLEPPSRLAPAPVEAAANCDPVPEAELGNLIGSAATAEGLDPRLIRAMVVQESGGRPCAVSPKGAQGLMQIMPATQAELGLADPFDPAASLAAGARYLKQLLNRYKGDLRLALAAYNAGANRVDDEKGVPRIAETENYVSSILGRMEPRE
jgi:soluble lytic murein transglycosylase-like protein